MPEYSFLTTWCLEAPREPVWEAIWDSERWPEWWRGVVAVELDRGRRDGRRPGRPLHLALEASLRPRLRDDDHRVEKPHLLEGEAVGELAGVGPLAPVRAGRPDGRDRRRLRVERAHDEALDEPARAVARPVFEWNHDWVMRNGGEGIAGLLGCRLLASD